jgi:hypothetical protein
VIESMVGWYGRRNSYPVPKAEIQPAPRRHLDGSTAAKLTRSQPPASTKPLKLMGQQIVTLLRRRRSGVRVASGPPGFSKT